MPSLLSLFAPRGSVPKISSRSNITEAPNFGREEIGPAHGHLRDELLHMYWAGVRRELAHIVLTLRRWQSSKDVADTVLPDEEDNLIHGFDTFLDQVSHSSRRFAHRYNETVDPEKPATGLPSYTEALSDRGWDMLAEMNSTVVKEMVRLDLEESVRLDVLRRRAKMLLQSAQFLDMDKVIEYREPEKLVSFWKRPAAPQLTIESYDKTNMPILSPEHCSSCQSILRGSMFRHVQIQGAFLCETCYRRMHYGDPSYEKINKHCCLGTKIKGEDSHKICLCPSVTRFDESGKKPLFPVDETSERHTHLNPQGTPGKLRCGLYELTDRVAESKFASTRLNVDKRITLRQIQREDAAEEQERLNKAAKAKVGTSRPTKLHGSSLVDPATMTAEFGLSYGVTDESYQSIPFYLRPITDNYPYGNVHMALRIGPLVIENGVEK